MREVIYTCNICSTKVDSRVDIANLSFAMREGSLIFTSPAKALAHICPRCLNDLRRLTNGPSADWGKK